MYSDGRIDCDHVSGLFTRRMSAGPDGVRDPVPNNSATSKAGTLIGVSGSSVRPIVISFSSSSRHQRAVLLVTDGCRQTATRVIVAHASRAISLFNLDRNHAAVRSPEVRRDRDHISPATLRRWRCLASRGMYRRTCAG